MTYIAIRCSSCRSEVRIEEPLPRYVIAGRPWYTVMFGPENVLGRYCSLKCMKRDWKDGGEQE